MGENIGLRWAIGAKLMAMRYGNSIVIGGDKIASAFPPTGDHDRSMEGAFRAMALANGGNRPEESYTTDERIRNDLDGSFVWDIEPMSRNYVFHRLVSSCPHCKGSGYVQKPRSVSARVPMYESSSVMSTEKTIVDRKPCSHDPIEERAAKEADNANG